MAMHRDLTWGREHTVQRADDVLEKGVPETCIILLTRVTPKSVMKRKRRIIFFLLYFKMCVYILNLL